MKRKFIYLLLLFSAVFLPDMLKGDEQPLSETVTAELKADRESAESLLAILTTNDRAELSLQQNNSLSSPRTFRRHSSFRVTSGKSAFHLLGNTSRLTPESVRTFLYSSGDYYARQELAGYYLYTLCKMLI